MTANRMKMILADGIETRDIFRLAAEQQVRIRRMNFRRDTLEDIFLKAMEEARAEQLTCNSVMPDRRSNGGCL